MDIQQLKQLKILVIGDSCQDIYHYGVCDRLSPEAPVPVLVEKYETVRFGMSGNVFSNVKSMGALATHITHPEIIQKHRYVDSRSKQHLMRVDIGDDAIENTFDMSMVDAAQKYDAVIISDYNKGFLSREACKELCEHFKNTQTPVFVDSKKKDLSCFSHCYLKINQKEHGLAQNLSNTCDVIVTLGDKGAIYNNELYPTDKVDVFDVCGAGDVFLSVLVLFFLLTKDIKRAIIYANRCATFSVTIMGTYVMTKKDLKILGVNSE